MSLENSYHFDTRYAVLRSSLLTGRLAMDVGYDWAWQKNDAQGADSSSSPTIQYDLDGTVLKDGKVPVAFNSYYRKEMVSRVFSNNYDVDSSGERVSVNYQNSFLPTQLSYSQSTSVTSGLTDDRTTDSTAMSMNSSHRYKELSFTYLSLTRSQYESQSEFRVGNDMSTVMSSVVANNSLNLDQGQLRRSLNSNYSYTDSKSDRSDAINIFDDWSKNATWTERLSWQMGRALFTGLNYRDTFYESGRSERKSQATDGWFRHRLFDNFGTNFRLGNTESTYLQGAASQWSGELSFDYSRHLPQACYLTLGQSNSYSIIDQKSESSVLQIVDRSFLFDATRFNYLEEYDILIETIVVRNEARTIVYEEGVDYLVEMIGRQIRIEIPTGSAISDGDVLSLDYDYLTNPDIKYGTTANSLYTSVDFFDNSYRLTAQVSRSTQELLAGDDVNVSLTDSTSHMVSLEKKIAAFTLKGEYAARASTTDKYHYWEQSVEYNENIKNYYLSASLRGRQSENEEIYYRGVLSSANSEKSLLARASVRKRLTWLPGTMWISRADYLQLDGQDNKRSDMGVNSTLQVNLGKSRIRLEGDVKWKDSNGWQSQESSLFLQFRRYF
jgi:hypothetical protein